MHRHCSVYKLSHFSFYLLNNLLIRVNFNCWNVVPCWLSHRLNCQMCLQEYCQLTAGWYCLCLLDYRGIPFDSQPPPTIPQKLVSFVILFVPRVQGTMGPRAEGSLRGAVGVLVGVGVWSSCWNCSPVNCAAAILYPCSCPIWFLLFSSSCFGFSIVWVQLCLFHSSPV